MDRIGQIFDIMRLSAHKRFEQSQGRIKEYCNRHGNEIAAKFVFAFQEAFEQAAVLQESQGKGAIRYLVLSHLHSSVWAGGYSVKLDIFDRRFYADPHEIDVYLALDWLYGFLSEDMDCIYKELIKQHIFSPRRHEMEQIRYRYVYCYHAVVLELISNNIPALLSLPAFKKMKVESDFEILFGGYMDKAETVWPKVEDISEVFSS
jgi:hypothetical protein